MNNKNKKNKKNKEQPKDYYDKKETLTLADLLSIVAIISLILLILKYLLAIKYSNSYGGLLDLDKELKITHYAYDIILNILPISVLTIFIYHIIELIINYIINNLENTEYKLKYLQSDIHKIRQYISKKHTLILRVMLFVTFLVIIILIKFYNKITIPNFMYIIIFIFISTITVIIMSKLIRYTKIEISFLATQAMSISISIVLFFLFILNNSSTTDNNTYRIYLKNNGIGSHNIIKSNNTIYEDGCIFYKEPNNLTICDEYIITDKVDRIGDILIYKHHSNISVAVPISDLIMLEISNKK